MQMQFWKEQLRHRNVSVAASATRAAAAAATYCCWLRLCVAGANQGDIDSFHPPSRDATARQHGSQGSSQMAKLRCTTAINDGASSMSLLRLLLPAGPAAAAACRELENVGAQGYPSVGLASWRYLLWYSAFSGFPRPHFTLPQ